MISAYLIHVEPEGDLFFTPEGVLVVINSISYQIYSLDSRHNFLRAAVNKFPLHQLQNEGVWFRNAQVKIELVSTIESETDKAQTYIRPLLENLYKEHSQRYFFLLKYLHSS